MKKLTTLGLSALTISVMAGLTFTPANAAWVPSDDSWSNNDHFFSFQDTTFGPMASWAQQNIPSPDGTSEHLCDVVQECLELRSGHRVQATYLLPICSPMTPLDCIEGLTTTSSLTDETVHSLRQLSGPELAPDAKLGYFGGSGPVLVDGIQNYIVRARMELIVGKSTFFSHRLGVEIIPVIKTLGSYFKVPSVSQLETDGRQWVGVSSYDMLGCVWSELGVCWKRAEHIADLDFRLKMKISDTWGGFVRGRLLEPAMELEAIAGGSALTVQGKALEVQKVFIKSDPKSWSVERLLNYCDQQKICLDNLASERGGIHTHLSNFPRAFAMLDAFREDAADTARALEGEWSFQINNSYSAGACTSESNGFLGMVTTNAPVIQDGFPTLDSGYLNYKVAGLHYAPDGKTVNEGTYDFVLRSDVARCIYGFTNAPVSATVAVVGEQGEEKVATTLVSETDGWLKLSAYGFTFSEKEIQVRLSQSQIKTLASFSSRGTTLSNSQKSQIRSVLAKSDGNTKFICTGIRYFDQPMRDNIKVRKRAKAACDYAKTIRPEHSYWYQTKVTQAKSYNGKVMVVSK